LASDFSCTFFDKLGDARVTRQLDGIYRQCQSQAR